MSGGDCFHVQHERGTDGLTMGRQVGGPWEDCDQQNAVDDQYAESRAVVAKVQAEMRAESLIAAEFWLNALSYVPREKQLAQIAQMLTERRENAAALDYAKTRLSEMRAAFDKLDATINSYMLGDIDGGEVSRVQRELREVARG